MNALRVLIRSEGSRIFLSKNLFMEHSSETGGKPILHIFGSPVAVMVYIFVGDEFGFQRITGGKLLGDRERNHLVYLGREDQRLDLDFLGILVGIHMERGKSGEGAVVDIEEAVEEVRSVL